MPTMLSMGDLLEKTAWTPKQIRSLGDRGTVKFKQQGSGPGCFRLFNIPTSVGLVYASQWMEAGYGPGVVTAIFRAIANRTEKQLVAEFKAGRTCLFPTADGMKFTAWPKGKPHGHFFDVKFIYDDLKQYLAEQRETAKNIKGTGQLRRASQFT